MDPRSTRYRAAMRAGRLLTMLSILEREGRTTARGLADRLEVTPRTVLRDVEALSEAGVPIFTVPGAGGGIEVLEGFRARLATLPAAAADGLLLLGVPATAAALGLGAQAVAARQAVLAALPPALVPRAVAVEQWFLHDPEPDPADAVPEAVTRALAVALASGWHAVLRDGDGDGDGEPVAPVGLVLAAEGWLLVHLAPHGPAVRALAGVRAVDVVQRPVRRPTGLDLAATWRQLRRTAPPRRAHGGLSSR